MSQLRVGPISTNALTGSNFCANSGCSSLSSISATATTSIGSNFCYNAGCSLLNTVSFSKVT